MLAPSPSQPPQPIPYGHVSLWDMMNFSLYDFAHALATLRLEHESWWRTAKEKRGDVPQAIKTEVAGRIQKAAATLRGMKLNKSVHRIDVLLGKLANAHRPMPIDELQHDLRVLAEALGEDMLEEDFYHYPRAKASLVKSVDEDWAATLVAFRSAKRDIHAAVDCYALGHNQASIYHCMMVLERGMPALATKLGVTFIKSKPTWRDMTDDIRAKIIERRRAIGQQPKGSGRRTKQQNAREDAFLDACGKAASEFNFFEHAWRNHIAHNRGEKFDENDAKKVLDHTKEFMETLARDLKLKEKASAKKGP